MFPLFQQWIVLKKWHFFLLFMHWKLTGLLLRFISHLFLQEVIPSSLRLHLYLFPHYQTQGFKQPHCHYVLYSFGIPKSMCRGRCCFPNWFLIWSTKKPDNAIGGQENLKPWIYQLSYISHLLVPEAIGSGCCVLLTPKPGLPTFSLLPSNWLLPSLLTKSRTN